MEQVHVDQSNRLNHDFTTLRTFYDLFRLLSMETEYLTWYVYMFLVLKRYFLQANIQHS